MITGILLVQAVAFAVLSGIVADKKRRDPIGWGLVGLVFGLFGFVAALVVEEVKQEERKSRSLRGSQSSTTRQFDPDEHEKKCPMCAEYIKLEARRCKHCGHEMSEEEVEQQIREVKREFEQQQVEKQQEEITQEGLLHCERSGNMVHTKILNADGTCPACGNHANDGKHPMTEDTSGGEG
jgi:DNA-directed RNA polymerase subunit M/transcription elongation factor TFIIS